MRDASARGFGPAQERSRKAYWIDRDGRRCNEGVPTGARIFCWFSLGSDAVFFEEAFLRDPDSIRRRLARQRDGLIQRSTQPYVEFLLSCEQHWHALMIDRCDERVRGCREKRVGFNLDLGAILLRGPLILAPDARKRKERSRL